MQDILVIKLGALGDFVQALGPMAAIRRYHPQARLTLLTTAPFVSFGKACGLFDRVLVDDRPRWNDVSGWLRLRRMLNETRFDRVYDLQNNDRTGLYFKLFKKRPEWVGIAKGASHRNEAPSRTAGHAFEGHVQTLRLAGITDVTPDDLSWVKGDPGRYALPEPYALLVPGCAPSRPEKRWPAEHYGTLARALSGLGLQPVVIGAESEKPLAGKILEIFPQATDLTGQTSLFDIALLARTAALAIGNDTGPMHIIAQTGCPSVVLFSQHSNPVKHAPIGSCVHVIRSEELADLPVSTVAAQVEKWRKEECRP